MSLQERQLLDYQKFLEYVASGKATAVDLVIRNGGKGILLTRRSEKPMGLSLPGSVRLPNEKDITVASWVCYRELKTDLINELGLNEEGMRGRFLGHTQEKFEDKFDDKDPRGPLAHDVYEFIVGDNSAIFSQCDEINIGFFDTIPSDIIPQHLRLINELGIKFKT